VALAPFKRRLLLSLPIRRVKCWAAPLLIFKEGTLYEAKAEDSRGGSSCVCHAEEGSISTPHVITPSVDHFIETLDSLDILPPDKVDTYDKTQEKITALAPQIDLIGKAMREELHLETLNSNLNIRLQSKRRRRK